MDPFEQELRDALGAAEPPAGGRHHLAPTAIAAHRRRRAARGAAAGVTAVVVVGALGLGVAAGLTPAPPRPPATTAPEPAPTSAAPTTQATSPPPTTATAAPDPSTPLLVASGGEVAVYEVAAGSDQAVLVRGLEPPPLGDGFSASPSATAISSGPEPVVCVVWWIEAPNDSTSRELACYAGGSSDPVEMTMPDGLDPVPSGPAGGRLGAGCRRYRDRRERDGGGERARRPGPDRLAHLAVRRVA